MMDSFKNGGMGKKAVTIMYIVASAGFILIKDVAVPLVDATKNTPSIAQQVAINTKRLEVIEAFNINIGGKVDILLQGSATREEAITNLKAVVDRIEKKLDSHMLR